MTRQAPLRSVDPRALEVDAETARVANAAAQEEQT